MTLVIIAGGAVAGAENFMRRSRAPLREPTVRASMAGLRFAAGSTRRFDVIEAASARPPITLTPTSISRFAYRSSRKHAQHAFGW
jgi:hypothetical protein